MSIAAAVKKRLDRPRQIEVQISEEELQSPAERQERRIQEVAKHVLEYVLGPRFKIPMLPTAAAEAMALANNPATSVQQLEKVVVADQMLTARVLAVASSPLYGLARPPKSLKQAMLLLGTGTLKDVLYQAVAEAHIFRGDAAKELDALRTHSVAVAHVARETCARLGIDGEHAFLCGLLHDLGRTFLIQYLRNERPDGFTDTELQRVSEITHASLGARIAERWRLPALVVEAIRRHHKYRGFENEGYSQVGHVVAVADRIAHHHGYGAAPRPIDPAGEACFFELALDPAQVEHLIAFARGLAGNL